MPEGSDEIRVLHVDDEPELGALSAEFLERDRDDFSVETTTSASAGLTLLTEQEIDCVVSDYDMPEKNGIEFLDAVREIYPDIPFILFTGKGSEEIASDAISAGVTDYLQKGGGQSQYEVLANRIMNAVEQRRANALAAETEQRLQRLAEHTNDILWMVSADWNDLLFVNSKYEDLWGLPVAGLEADPQSTIKGVHPEDRDNVRDAMASLSAGHAIDIEHRVNPTEDYGRWVWVEAKPIMAANGNDVEVIVGFVRDITTQKERERALERERDRFTQLYNNFPEPTLTYRYTDAGPIITDVNDAFQECFGYNAETAVGTPVDELLVPEQQHDEARELDQRVRAGEHVDAELRRRTATGERDFWFQNIPLSDTPTPNGFAVYADITDQKERERDLERFKTVVAATGDPLYTLDADGHFTYVNDALLEITGHDEATLLNAHSSTVMDDADLTAGTDLIRQLLATDEIRGTFEMNLLTADGDRITCENHIALLPFEEAFRGTVGVLRDITDRIERQRRLERERDRLNEFANVLSHDLRSPLNVAMGHIELAQSGAEHDHLETAMSALERIDNLTGDLLSKARKGKTVESLEPVSVRDLATHCWQHVDSGDTTLTIETDSTISADRNRLKQLFENLFRNAIQHGGNNATITVGTLPGGFYIADDGPGIPEETRARVFESGYTTINDGTGFGLATVKRIAAAHNWQVALTTSKSGGACFEFTGITPAD